MTNVTYGRHDALGEQLAIQLLHRCCFGENEPFCPLPQRATALQPKLGQSILQCISTCSGDTLRECYCMRTFATDTFYQTASYLLPMPSYLLPMHVVTVTWLLLALTDT